MNKVQKMLVDRLIEKMEAGEIPWKKSWTRGGSANLASGRPYRGFNRLLLGGSKWWLSFKQVQDLKGKIKPGAKGSPCIFWKFFNDEDNEKEWKRAFCRYYTVFPIEAVELPAELPTAIYNRLNLATTKNDPIESAQRILSGYLNRPEIHSGEPSYIPAYDSITIPGLNDFKTPESYYKTLFHELTHSTGAEKRLNRREVVETQGVFGHNRNDYGKEELIAEFGAAFLVSEAGIACESLEANTAAYLQHWLKVIKETPVMLYQAAQAAQKSFDYILGTEPEKV